MDSTWTADYEVALSIDTLKSGDSLFTAMFTTENRSKRRTLMLRIAR